MIKIALVKVMESAVDTDYWGENLQIYRHFEGLDFQEVTASQLERYRQAARLYNSKHASKGVSLAIVTPLENDEKVALLEDLLKFEEAEQARMTKAQEEQRLLKEKAAEKKKLGVLKRSAKALGISVEELMALQQKKNS